MNKLTEELLAILVEFTPGGFGGIPGAFMTRPSLAVEVGAIIRRYRLSKKMSQLALAQKMNVDAATISRHEHGANLSLDLLPEYADSLGVKVQNLLPQEEVPQVTGIDEKQIKIDQAVRQFQELHNLSDEKLDKVLALVEGVLKLSVDDVDSVEKG